VSTRLSDLEPWLQPWARWLLSLWPSAQVTSTRRTSLEQSRLYEAFLAGASRYPAAPPGQSLHEYGRAFDIIAEPAALEQLGRVWEYVGGRWGGRAGDPIHFEA
jgi:hypothetical protein